MHAGYQAARGMPSIAQVVLGADVMPASIAATAALAAARYFDLIRWRIKLPLPIRSPWLARGTLRAIIPAYPT